MFLVSSPELVIAECLAGIVGTFPSLNARPSAQLDEWIGAIEAAVGERPYGVNLIVHKSNPRLNEDLAVCVRHRVPLVITSVGEPSAVVDAVHAYGGLVFHDVISIRHARKALSANVDGLILVCAGAGGHGGLLNPFAFVGEVRDFFAGPIVLSGALTSGRHIRAAQWLGADLAYMGTRFIATEEANASIEYKQMLLDSAAADLVYTDAFTGVHGNYLRPSLVRSGLDPDRIPNGKQQPDLSLSELNGAKAWKDIWGAGQGVGSIKSLPSVSRLVAQLSDEYAAP